jgi:hypothetical protein
MKGTSLTYNHNRKRSIKEHLRDEEAAIHTEVHRPCSRTPPLEEHPCPPPRKLDKGLIDR